jgi:predicted nucleotidyltransferase
VFVAVQIPSEVKPLAGVPLVPFTLSDLPLQVLQALVMLGTSFQKKGVTLFLFGSFAQGRARPRSDLDIAATYSSPTEKSRLKMELYDALEKLPTVRPIDLVDLDSANPELAAEVHRDGIPLDQLHRRFHAQTAGV